MPYIESKIFIKPSRDTSNSEPYEMEFTLTSNGTVALELESGRTLTFTLSAFNGIVEVANLIAKQNEG